MEAAAGRCGLDEPWKIYSAAKRRMQTVFEEEMTGHRLDHIRRIISRSDAQAMFGDLANSGGLGLLKDLQILTQYGLGSEMIGKAMTRFAPQVARHSGQKREGWEKVYNDEMQAVLSFAKDEQRVNYKRYAAWEKPRLKDLQKLS